MNVEEPLPKMFVFNWIAALVVASVLCCSCGGRPSTKFRPDLSIYKVTDGERIFGPAPLLGIVQDSEEGMMIVLNETNANEMAIATSSAELHDKDVSICLGDQQIGQLRIIRGFGSGYLRFEGDFSDVVSSCRKGGVAIRQVTEFPIKSTEVRALFKEIKQKMPGIQ